MHTRYITNLIFISSILFVISSCTSEYPDKLERALELAGSNKSELLEVLNHYKTDSLKYKAACFLIENMPYHYFYEGEELEKCYQYFKLSKDRKNHFAFIRDSLEKTNGSLQLNNLKQRQDIQFLKSSYLIQNIDWAFKVWEEQPWGKNVSFDSFCQYVLPYCIGDEIRTDWRRNVYNEFNILLDSIRELPNIEDPLLAGCYVLKILTDRPFYFTGEFPYTPHIGPQIIDWAVGSCREMTDRKIYVLRALGIPAGMDRMIVNGDNNDRHSWCFILDKNGETHMTEAGDTEIYPASEYEWPKLKIVRNTYCLNWDMQVKLKLLSTDIHPNFRNTKYQDVTSLYTRYNKNYLIPTNLLYDLPNDKIIYLCASLWQNWEPLAWTEVKKDSLLFTNLEGGVIARLATFQNGNLSFHSDPFILDKKTNNIRFFSTEEGLEQIILYRKYILGETFLPLMIGGVFEGSNCSDFSKSDTLHIITDIPNRLITSVILDCEKSYRYFRYVGPEKSHCNVAEIAVYENESDDESLKGKILGTSGCGEGDGSHEYTNVFDKDLYTSFDYKEPNGGWVGMDFGKPLRIRKITYTPRNRDNFVREGDMYELFYWANKSWISAGVQVAQADSLLYTVPKGSLLYLKNYTRGRQERVFEYTNNKQVFW